MTKDELVAILTELQSGDSTEEAHVDADDALLKFIDDPDIAAAYHKIERWYA